MEIQLDRDDYNVAMVKLGIPVAAANHDRITAFLMVTPEEDDAVAQSVDDKTFVVPGYPSGIGYECYDFYTQWHSYSDDGYLSARNFGAGTSRANYYTRLNRSWIDGDKLKIELINQAPYSGHNATITLEVEFRAWRTP